MNSRMDKYEYDEQPTSRTARNKDLYNEISKTEVKFNSFSNAKVIDESAKDIDLEKIKKYIEKMGGSNTPKRKSLLDAATESNKREVKEEIEKDHDLISVLEKAREKREVDYQKERYKKLRDTQYDILSNLNLKDRKQEPEPEEKFNTQEKTLIDLINTVAHNKNKNDLLSELSGGSDETIIGSINEESSNSDLRALISEEINKTKPSEISKTKTINTVKPVGVKEKGSKNNQLTKEIEPVKNIDNSFYTSSLNFSKEDFEGFEDVEKKSGIAIPLTILFIIILILGVLFVISNFVFDLNIF